MENGDSLPKPVRFCVLYCGGETLQCFNDVFGGKSESQPGIKERSEWSKVKSER